jgi:hypothetical protein
MRKALLAAIVATSLSLWSGSLESAYAKNLACQGAQAAVEVTTPGSLQEPPTFSGGIVETMGSQWGAGELLPAALFTGGSALWSVTVSGSIFTGGNLTSNRSLGSSVVLTCSYTLDPTSSSTSSGGNTLQTLVWDPVSGNPGGCQIQFTDEVYLIANGAAGVMIDNNLAGEGRPGAGTCLLP